MAYTINIVDHAFDCECCGSYCDSEITITSDDSSFEESGYMDDHFGYSNHLDPFNFLIAREGFVFDQNPIVKEENQERYVGFTPKYSMSSFYNESLGKEFVQVFDLDGKEIASCEYEEFTEISNLRMDATMIILALRLVGVEVNLIGSYENHIYDYEEDDDYYDEDDNDEVN